MAFEVKRGLKPATTCSTERCCCPKDDVKLLLVHSSRGGVDATSRRYRRRHPLTGADGVVRNISDHPVCASKVASQRFLIAQPPLLWRRGIAASFRFVSF